MAFLLETFAVSDLYLDGHIFFVVLVICRRLTTIYYVT